MISIFKPGWAAVTLAFCATLSAQEGWTVFSQDVTRANLWSVAYGNGTLVVAGEQGTILVCSYSDKIWRQRSSGTAEWLVGVGFGAGRFVVVGDRGTILTSDDDGATWAPRNSGTTTRLNAAAYGGGRWLVVGEQGVVLTSTDGSTWTTRPALGSDFLRALAYGQGQFLIGGANGALYVSLNATTFTPVPVATRSNIESAAISGSRFWIVGSNGLWASAAQLGVWSFGPNVTTTTFRGVAARTTEEAVAVAELGAAVYRNGAWAVDSPAPPFLATAVTQGENEMIAVGFAGGIARADLTRLPVISVNGRAPVEYGADVKLVGSVGTNQIVTYQWYTGAGVLIPGATGSELDVSHITPETSDYRLGFTQAGGSGSLGVTVPLYPAGQIEVRDPRFSPALPGLPSLVVPQPDGKLLVSGSFTVTPSGGPTYGLARLNADGSLDPGFRAGDGIAPTSTITAMHVLTDGRIYVRGNFSTVAGQARAGLARLQANGSLDAAFQPRSLSDAPNNSAPAPDGRLYVQSGVNYFNSIARVVRLALDGSLDPTFGPLDRHHLVGVDGQGRVLAVDFTGSSPLLVRYQASGARDNSYLATPVTSFREVIQTGDELSVTAITDSGIYAAASYWTRVGISYAFVKFLPNGGRDLSYQSPPLHHYDGKGFSFAYRPDGGLWRMEAGPFNGYVVTSYSPTGERDGARHATRPDNSDYQILAVAPDGSLLAIGNRYSPPQIPTFMRLRPVTGRAGRITNLSVRSYVAGANDPLIAGFVTTGSDSTTALVRAVGPGLQPFGVSDAMFDPQLALVRDGTTVASNDNWNAALGLRFASVGAFALPAGSRDAANESSVGAGNYTVVVVPASGEGGTGLVELYQSSDPFTATRRFINVSSRGFIDAGHPLIAGFTITGDVPVKVLVRAAGPALAAPPFALPGTLADPQLTLYRGSSALWDNDNWNELRIVDRALLTNTAASVGAFPFPADSKDSAMVVTLAPGNYTAVVTGSNGSRGVALVEVYQVP